MTVCVSTSSPGPWFNKKMSSYQYRKSHCGDNTVVRSSYLHNGISYTGKTSLCPCTPSQGPRFPSVTNENILISSPTDDQLTTSSQQTVQKNSEASALTGLPAQDRQDVMPTGSHSSRLQQASKPQPSPGEPSPAMSENTRMEYDINSKDKGSESGESPVENTDSLMDLDSDLSLEQNDEVV